MSAALAKAYWLVYDGSVSDDDARSRFEKKLGYAAQEVIRENGYTWVGPLQKLDTEHLETIAESNKR